LDTLEGKKLEAAIGRANACILEYEVQKMEMLAKADRIDGEIVLQKEVINKKKQELSELGAQ